MSFLTGIEIAVPQAWVNSARNTVQDSSVAKYCRVRGNSTITKINFVASFQLPRLYIPFDMLLDMC